MLSSPSTADTYLGAAGGAFVSYAGDVGWTVMLEMGADLPNPHFRLGGEVAFATDDPDFDLAAYGAGTGTVEATLRFYQLDLVGRFVLFPGRLSPYVGVRGGFAVVDFIDGNLVAAVGNPAIVPANTGVGVTGGVGGLVGIEMPMYSRELNLFLEGRADYEWELTDALRPVLGPDDWSGISVVLGLRARF
jgi:hypothetical protein